MNFIWQTFNGDQTDFEYEYITEMLFKNHIKDKFFDNGSFSTILDNSIIIYSNNQNQISQDFENYLNEFINKGFKFYLLHLSNENLSHDHSYYRKAEKVFRNYYNPNIESENVSYIPLGFKSGFYNKNFNSESFDKKELDFSFIGQIKSDRKEMYDNLLVENSFVHLTQGWNCPTSLSPPEIIDLYKKTRFTPCPMGWSHPDSFRIMESLEWGSIPILKRYDNSDYHVKVWGETPIPIIDEWNEINKFSKMSEDHYNKMYQNVFDWYSEYRKKIIDLKFSK